MKNADVGLFLMERPNVFTFGIAFYRQILIFVYGKGLLVVVFYR